MMTWLSILWIIFSFQDVAYKPKEEFEIKLDYKFKQRPSQDHNQVNFDETRKEQERRTSGGILPYLILNVKILMISSNESKVKVTNNLDAGTTMKRIEQGMIIPVDCGFTDDVKDGVTPNQYVLSFLSPKREEINRIVIFIDKDGTFLVNGEKRGKF
jgi:hypothetical protein